MNENPSPALRSRDELLRPENLKRLVEGAAEAFWAKVAEMVPEAESGDFAPDHTAMIERSMKFAIAEWVSCNVPELPASHPPQNT